jgi:hypothetical protein
MSVSEQKAVAETDESVIADVLYRHGAGLTRCREQGRREHPKEIVGMNDIDLVLVDHLSDLLTPETVQREVKTETCFVRPRVPFYGGVLPLQHVDFVPA